MELKREEKEREVEEVQSLNEGRERAEREEEGILEPFKKREKGDDGLKKDRSLKRVFSFLNLFQSCILNL